MEHEARHRRRQMQSVLPESDTIETKSVPGEQDVSGEKPNAHTTGTEPEQESPEEPRSDSSEEQGKAPQNKSDPAGGRIRSLLRELRSLMVRLVLMIIIVYVLFFHLVGITLMPNEDMTPRIDAGDLLLYYRLADDIRAQDVVVFRVPAERVGKEPTPDSVPAILRTLDQGIRRIYGRPLPEGDLFVGRVVAASGDTVEIDDRLMINGNAVIETKIYSPTQRYEGFGEYPVTLGQGEFFILSDRRSGGADSRFFGPVSRSEILGTVITLVRRNNL